MEIRAGGKVWDVETEASRPLSAEEASFCGITFRDRSDREGQVSIGWVPRAARLTSRDAVRLFELAGERLWRDLRTGIIHRVIIEDTADEVIGPLSVRFVTAAGSCSTRYELPVPIGLAEDEALQRLLDRSLLRGPGPLAAD